MHYYILSREELDDLLAVPTTTEQAALIMARNLWALHALFAGEREIISMPCPHCGHTNGDWNCSKCVYTDAECKRSLINPSYVYRKFACCRLRFGGEQYEECNLGGVVALSDDAIKININTGRDVSICRSDPLWQKCYRFLQGHVEWAYAVLHPEESRTYNDESPAYWRELMGVDFSDGWQYTPERRYR